MKRAIFRLTDHFLMDFLSPFKNGKKFTYEIEDGFPPDAKIVRTGHDSTGQLCIVLESEEFEDIKEGNKYPYIKLPIIHTKTIEE